MIANPEVADVFRKRAKVDYLHFSSFYCFLLYCFVELKFLQL